jgi:hypothetical protein
MSRSMDRRRLLRSAGSVAVAGSLGALGVTAPTTSAYQRGTIGIELRSGYDSNFRAVATYVHSGIW